MITAPASLSRRWKLFSSTAIGARVLHVVRAIVAVVVTTHDGPIDSRGINIVVIRGGNVCCREEECGDEDGGRDHAPLRHQRKQWHLRFARC